MSYDETWLSGMRHNSPPRSALTRVIPYREALLVLAMILVGAFVLIAVGRRTSTNQQNLTCVRNVRDLGIALVQYAEDHDGTMQPYTNVEPQLAAQLHSHAPTTSDEPAQLRSALRIYTDEQNWFCPIDPVSKQKKYYLGVRHEYTSYAFPAFQTPDGSPAKLNDIPIDLRYGLVWDAAGSPDTCDDGLWFAGSRHWASNHPDGRVNVVLSDLSLRQLPALLPNGAGLAP